MDEQRKKRIESAKKKRVRNNILAGVLASSLALGIGANALLPEDIKQEIKSKIGDAIYTTAARQSENSYSSPFSIPFTRYNHIDTSESVKSDILQARKDLGESLNDFVYNTAQNQSRAISGRTLEDLTLRDSLEKTIQQQNEVLENQKNWEIRKPESNKIQKEYIVNEDFVSYIIHVESSGRANAVGNSGERGLMQIMGPTWHDATKRLYGQPISFDKAFNPKENIEAGVAQLEWLEQIYLPTRILEWDNYSEKKKRDSIIAAYNLGASKFINDYHGNPYHKNLPQTTKNYITKVDSLVYGKKEVAPDVHRWAGIIQDTFED